MTDFVQLYAEATGNDEWAEALDILPDHMRESVVRYIVRGIPGGSFLTAVFEGDLFEAFRRADASSLHALPAYGHFLVNYAPAGCFGSPDRVRGWISAGGLNGLKAKTDA